MSEQFSGRVEVVDSENRKVFQFDSSFAVLDLGAQGNEGDLRLYGDDGGVKIHLDGGRSLLELNDDTGYHALRFDAHFALIDVGVVGNEGDLRVIGDDGNVMIHLDGGTGDITLAGEGCAEDFDIGDAAGAEPGSVMTLDDQGRLVPCSAEYDTRVAGVISGAGGRQSGLLLGRQPLLERRSPLALTGKARCWVDAGYAPVAVGDLLTTSPTVGHAMRATDPARAFGATIGKALRPLASGTDLLPILVALQ